MNINVENAAAHIESHSVEAAKSDEHVEDPSLAPHSVIISAMKSGEDGGHLHPHVRAYLSEPVSMRLRRVSADVLVSYPELNHVLNEARWLIHAPTGSRARGIFVGAGNGSGKTSIAKLLVRDYPVSRRLNQDDEHPRVLSINLAGLGSTKALLSRILEAANVPFSIHHVISDYETIVIKTLRAMKCALLIADEAQDILMGSRSDQIRVIGVLKRLMTDLSLPILALGTLDGKNVFQADKHMAARFSHLEIPRWDKGEKFGKFLFQYEKHIPLKRRSNLSHEEIQSCLIENTNGSLDEMLVRLKLAAEHAIVSRTEQITVKLLERAQSHTHISALLGGVSD